MKKKRSFGRKPRNKTAGLPVWVVDGINSATGGQTCDSIEMAANASLLVLKTGTSDAMSLNTIGKFVAYIRLLCINDDAARKKNACSDMWGLSLLCAEIFRDYEQEMKASGHITLGDGDYEFIASFVRSGKAFLIRHTENECAKAWLALENPGVLNLLLGIDPDTGEYNADDGKLDKWFAERAAA